MKTLFILNLNIQKRLEEVETYLKEHYKYLEYYYSKGNFICSGRKNPRTGELLFALSCFHALD